MAPKQCGVRAVAPVGRAPGYLVRWCEDSRPVGYSTDDWCAIGASRTFDAYLDGS